MFRVKEAIEKHNQENKEQIKMIDLGRILWEDSSEQTQRMNISRLCNGSVKSVKIEHVRILCQELKCDANYLFGFKKG